MPIATATRYTRELTAARAIETQAAHELAIATKRATIDPAFAEVALTRDPAGYAEYLRKVADIAAGLPLLRNAARAALDAVSELEKQMCSSCRGTGVYDSPTRALAQGRAYCFTCGGDGRSKAYRG